MQVSISSKSHCQITPAYQNRLSFRGPRLPNQTYEVFEDFAKRTNFLSKIQETIGDLSNYVDAGGKNIVFKIPELEGFLLRVPNNDLSETRLNIILKKSQDDFPTINVGQKIANLGDGISIILKQNGTLNGIKAWGKVYSGEKKAQTYIDEYLSKLNKLANLEQSAFDDFAKEIRIIRQKGYKFDFFSPKNILIDKNINIVDVQKEGFKKHLKFLNTDFLYFALIDKINLFKFYKAATVEQQTEMKSLIKTIKQKMDKAAQKHAIPQNRALGKLYYLCCDIKNGFKYSQLKKYSEFCKFLDATTN